MSDAKPVDYSRQFAPRTAEELTSRIESIERLERSGAPIAELMEAIRGLNRGTVIGMPRLHTGLKIYRSVRLEAITSLRSRISYPPAARIDKYQRLNGPGESLFYGCLEGLTRQRPFEIGCLYECLAAPGERYVIGEWAVTHPMMVGHVGYSSAPLAGNPSRAGKPWMEVDDPNPIAPQIRRWQSDIFTRKASSDSERTYRLSNAIAKFCMIPNSPALDGFEIVSGVTYPSVAACLGVDNVALLPCEVDRALSLKRTWFVEIHSVDEVSYDPRSNDSEEPVGRIDVKPLDASRECRADGTIIWESSRMIYTPFSWTRANG